jgi:Arc/MetJ family transcription regulator
MRIRIDLDDDLLEDAMRHSSARTKQALVEEALRTFVRVKAEEVRRSSYRERLASIRARTASLRLTKGVNEILDHDRSRL